MKKIYFLLFFSLAVSISFAQVKSSHLASMKLNKSGATAISKNDLNLQKSTIQITETECNTDVITTSFASIKDAVQARAKAPQAAPTVSYRNPDGTLLYGFTRDYKSYTNYFFLYSPAKVPFNFVPYTDTPSAVFSWVYPASTGNQSLADDTNENGILQWTGNVLPAGHIYYVPTVTATANDDSSTFQLGQGVTTQYMFSGDVQRDDPTGDGTSLGSVSEYPPLTLANLQANKPASGNLYGSFTNVGGFSPSYVHPTYGACTGLMQIMPQLVSPFYAESVSVLAYTIGGTAIPEGGVLKIQFYYLNEDGSLGDLIAESTTNEFVKTYDPQGVFVFTFEEEEDGFVVEKPLVLGTKAPIVIIISGFDATWDFNVLFGTNGSIPGTSYTLHGDHVATFGFSNAPDVPRADMYIQFNGIFNCLQFYDAPQTLVFPVEGGAGVAGIDDTDGPYNDVDISSSFDYVNDDVWIESMPDWVTDYEFDNSYFASANALMLFAKADALPAGVTGRSGNIVVGSYGVTLSVPVTQGNVTGIPFTKAQPTTIVRDGDNFVLKYPASTALVSIYNVAGQKVASYPLPAAGTFTVPAENYVKGVYLFSFSGAKGVSTVKVIR